jgi:NAD(P)-dependent dehydrogenase (short-subunit alcohol dehydrogenase family)
VRTAASAGGGRLAVLVHCAARHLTASVDDTAPADLDAVLRLNLRAPIELTRLALPLLRAGRGDIVFMNSSAARSAPASNAAYAVSKAGLRAFADSLRAEVNRDGIRVLSVVPGRTATDMQAAIFDTEGKAYRPELLLQPDDVAAAVVAALDLPRTAESTELHIRPAIKSP